MQNHDHNNYRSDEPVPKKRLDSFTKWKIWMINNFEYHLGASTDVKTILHEANGSEKENVGHPLTACNLGRIVNQVWNIKASRIRRKNTETYYAYRNLKQMTREPVIVSNVIINLDFVDEIQLQNRWTRVKDSKSQASLVYNTGFEFQKRRVTHEICFKLEETGALRISIKSGCFEITTDDEGFPLTVQGTPTEQTIALMQFIESSRICSGFSSEIEENDQAVIGTFTRIHEHPSSVDELKVFSIQCNIFTPTGGLCTNCNKLRRKCQQRSRRKSSEEHKRPSKFCNNRWLSKEDVVTKYLEEKKKRVNAEAREKLLRQKIQNQMVTMEEADHKDLTSILNDIDKKDVPPEMGLLFEEQRKILNTQSPTGYRWHPKVIRLCLDLYCKNPHVLDSLRKFVYLPSQRTIRRYKSKVEQKPGWNPQVISWCLEEAKKKGLKEQDFWGGLLLDEMKIQEDLEMSYSHGKHKLVGFVDLGEIHNHMSVLSGNTKAECQLAQHVIQFVFLSDCGFRFPIAQFPSADCTPTDLYFLFWEGVGMMYEYDFIIYWCVLDGAEVNRQFIKLHFKESDPADSHFTTHNIHTGEPLVFIVDCKHNFKKIRNNIEKSNDNCKPRCLTFGTNKILWRQLYKAFEWDQTNHSLPVHEKLTFQHFQLDPATRMRNSLAEDVLDTKMLLLLEAHRRSMNPGNRAQLDGIIAFVKNTSPIISFFSDKLFITHLNDPRLKQLQIFYSFLKGWKDQCSNNEKHFISQKLWFDLQSMSLGFMSLAKIKLAKFPNSVLKPAIVNQDCVENHFGQIRSCNGQNNNPTYKLQQSCQNSIILGQTLISRKSNAGEITDGQTVSLPGS